MKQFLAPIYRLTRYNIQIIFGSKFVYFALSAIVLYVLLVIIGLFSDEEFAESTAFNILLMPSLLLIFYPMCFGIQNDQDARTIEIIFGTPDYRYKVWLFRLLIAYLICFFITFLLALLTDFLLVQVPVFEMTFQVMVPAFLVGMLSFMFSALIRNGSGTAVVVIIFGLFFFVLGNNIEVSKWNVFLNPYNMPLNTNPAIYYSTLIDNRIILLVASFVFLLIGLYKTQNREKFV